MYFNDGGGGGGGSERGSYFIPKKSQLQNLSAKKSLLFLAYSKKPHTSSKLRLCYCWFELMKSTIPQINPCVFFATPQTPRLFRRPQKIPFDQNFRPKRIPQTPPPPPRVFIACRTDRADSVDKKFIIWICWLFRFWKRDRELEFRTTTYGPGTNQSQHARSVSHIIKSVTLVFWMLSREG